RRSASNETVFRENCEFETPEGPVKAGGPRRFTFVRLADVELADTPRAPCAGAFCFDGILRAATTPAPTPEGGQQLNAKA
ncbi:MAG: hypothetical protein ACRDV3_02770, partial [Acidothermaceae bacterium]